MSTQYVKNTNAPPQESELWTVGEGWKISAKGKTYTNLSKIIRDERHPENEVNDLFNVLIDQLDGRVTEPVDYANHYFVAGTSVDGAELVYAFEKNDLDGANRQVKYSKQPNTVPTVQSLPKPQQQTFKSQPQASNTSASSTVTTNTAKPTIVRPTTEVVYKRRLIAENDAMSIEQAEEEGLYTIPVKNTGVENWGFVDQKTGERMFYYGRIKLVELD